MGRAVEQAREDLRVELVSPSRAPPQCPPGLQPSSIFQFPAASSRRLVGVHLELSPHQPVHCAGRPWAVLSDCSFTFLRLTVIWPSKLRAFRLWSHVTWSFTRPGLASFHRRAGNVMNMPKGSFKLPAAYENYSLVSYSFFKLKF